MKLLRDKTEAEEVISARPSILVFVHHQVQEVPEEEMAISKRVHGILLKANGNRERMRPSTASECLTHAGLGLRFVQVPAIISAVEDGEDGLFAAEEVANAVAGVMCALKQLHARQHANDSDEKVEVFKTSRKAEGLAKVSGLNADEFKVSQKNVAATQ